MSARGSGASTTCAGRWRRAIVCVAAWSLRRNLGPEAYAYEPATFDKYAIAGLADPSPHVQLDAAWLAGLVATPDSVLHEALKDLVSRLGTPEDGSQQVKTLERANKTLADIEARRTPA